MVDFKKLRESKSKPRPVNPREIFNSIPRPHGINDLYGSQTEVLDSWFGRRAERDVVIKLHTGGGKTLVALLMAQSALNESGEPVIYLAPTNQLVDQVIAKSKQYSIPATRYVVGRDLPNEFFEGKAVLACTYEALFNGRSKFGIRGAGQPIAKAGTIILDDAHVALSSVRDAFSLVIETEKHPEIYGELASRFRTAFREVGRGGTFADIVEGKDFGVVEVPSWAWQRRIEETHNYLASRVDAVNRYVWPFLRDGLDVCHCLFSRRSVTITPILPLVDLIPTFDDCRRRVYMSATITDDSDIVRTFDASAEALARPVTSASLAGVGERMILVPELMRLRGLPTIPLVKGIVREMAPEGRGTLILTPSSKTAEGWTDVALLPTNAKDVAAQVAAMQSGTSFGPLVLANRYDGIDLAGDSCRLLVVDGLPQGTSDYDVHRMQVMADTAVSALLAQRIEQGMGRGTRGGGDHCVVMLVGSRLVGWIGRKGNLAQLTASTRVQLAMGQEVSATVTTADEVVETVAKCLDRERGWTEYHASELAEAAHSSPVDLVALGMSGTERKAFRLQRLGQFEAARQALRSLMDDPMLRGDAQRRAWLAASAARISFQMADDQGGQKLQTTAFCVNANHCPPRVRPVYVARPIPRRQSQAIVRRLSEYNLRGAMVADFDEAVANLVRSASAARYEEALAELGTYLGFDAERPEKVFGKGPDVLWRTDAAFDFVIEAKSKKEDNPLYKNDHAQLLEAEAWFNAAYPGRGALRLSALPQALADVRATAKGSFALRLEAVDMMVGTLRSLLVELAVSPGDAPALGERCEAGLVAEHLTPEGIRTNFLVPFAEATRKA